MKAAFTIPESTADVHIPTWLIDQVLGQDQAVRIVRLAAQQKRFLLIVGPPGTGKSLLGQAVAELLATEKLEDILVEHNPDDPMLPRVSRHTAGRGAERVARAREESRKRLVAERYLMTVAFTATLIVTLYYSLREQNLFYLGGGIAMALLLYCCRRVLLTPARHMVPRLLVNNKGRSSAPFIDATGSQAGALLGDVRHDPYQSGGSETPPHQLLEAGAIHRAHGGVLFIDEVSTLSMESQQSLLTAIQARELAITGRSAGSSGSMVRSEPVPCEFLMILAGNVEDIEKMHPALRSRIRGYGYEIFTQSAMDNSPVNRMKLVQFIAQEVRRDGKIPHFSRNGIEAILDEACLRAGQPNCLTTCFRELGGLVRIAGDLAVQDTSRLAHGDHVKKARTYALTLEEQQLLQSQILETSAETRAVSGF